MGPVGRAAAAAAVLLALAAVAFIVLQSSEPYTVKAQFQSAAQLVDGNLVQVSGRKVGLVRSIDLTEDGLAEVELEIDERFAPLRAGTTATIRMASLSGVANRYVDLALPPGTEQRKIARGGTIPIEDTVTNVDLDQLFALFDKRTREGLRNVIRGFGDSYESRSAQANLGYRYLNPSLVATERLFDEINRDTPLLREFLVANSRLVTDLADRREDLAALIDRFATATGAIGAEKASLTSAVAQLPPFMRRANSTFVNLRATLDDLDPLLDESRPVTPKLRRVLADLKPFAEDARPTLRDLSALTRRPGEGNDLIELAHSVPAFRDIAIRGGNFNGARREGSFPAGTKSLRSQTPVFAFQRPYVVDFTGWFDDFSHSGIYDANGSASRVATSANAFAVQGTTLAPLPEELRPDALSRLNIFTQRDRCPGATERPASPGSNPYKPSPDYPCDENQRPIGK